MSGNGTALQRPFLRGLQVAVRKVLGVGPAVAGAVRWGDFRRTEPIGRGWGYERGSPVDRYYIEAFLSRNDGDISGRVLEIQNDDYSRRFGGSRVSQCDILDIDEANSRATIIADLNDARNLPAEAFNCMILTQTLQLVYDFASALRSLERSLAPGGIALITVPGITRVPTHFRWYWSFTLDSVNRLLEETFPGAQIDVTSFGNVKAATAFLHGLAQEELRPRDMDHNDPIFPVIIAARVRKA